MSEDKRPEAWLRGSLPGVHPMIAPVLRSFELAREDVAEWTKHLTTEQIWARPFGLNPVGREIRHIGGSADRLTTYLEGKQLSADQTLEMKHEFDEGASREELLEELAHRLARAESVMRSIDPARLTEQRAVGRKQLPTTVIGLIVHIAEHTQRHVGQAISAAKLITAETQRRREE